jgi:hypothetical protein
MTKALRLHEDEQRWNKLAKTRKIEAGREVNEQSFAAHVAKT